MTYREYLRKGIESEVIRRCYGLSSEHIEVDPYIENCFKQISEAKKYCQTRMDFEKRINEIILKINAYRRSVS